MNEQTQDNKTVISDENNNELHLPKDELWRKDGNLSDYSESKKELFVHQGKWYNLLPFKFIDLLLLDGHHEHKDSQLLK